VVDFIGFQQDRTIAAIQAFDGTRLRIRIAVFGQNRPTEFTSPPESSTPLVLLFVMPSEWQ